jgi:exodeoxyribonuclease-3
MRIVSWNVNGIRAVTGKGFWNWFHTDAPDILCLQETRIQDDQLTDEMRDPPGCQVFWHHAERKGYSGVATFTRAEPLEVRTGFGRPEFDIEGRVLVTRFPDWVLVNAYFPSGRRDRDRVAFKLRFYDELLSYCQELRSDGLQLIVCGDLNTAHQPIDLARPAQNKKTSGFLPEEREALGQWLDEGFVDIYRHLHPAAEEYTWWTYRYNARARNVGWRIDCFLIDEALVPQVTGARILGEVQGSDHCPIELSILL